MIKKVSLSIISFFTIIVHAVQVHTQTVKCIDTFNSNLKTENSVPSGWHPSRKDISMYSLCEDSPNDLFTRIATHGGCTSIGKQCTIAIDQYPFLQWRWRVHTLPDKGNEKIKRTNDSGAGVYVIFKGKFKLNTIIKYVWSTTLPVGSTLESPYNSRTKIVVLQSGEKHLGKWKSQKVDIKADYARLFGSPLPEIEAIGILSDSDNTKSIVMADYDDLEFSK